IGGEADGTLLHCPIDKAEWRIFYVFDIGEADGLNLSPRSGIQIGVAKIGTAEVGASQVGAGEIGSGEVGILQIGVGEVGVGERGSAEVFGLQIAEGEAGAVENTAAQIGGIHVAAIQLATLEADSKEKCVVRLNANKRDAVMVQLLHGIDAAAIAAFALRRINDLPCLVVALHGSDAGFGEIENHGD